MTLGELLTALKSADPDARIVTTQGSTPLSFVSYRPVPSEAAMTSRTDRERKVRDIVMEIEAAFARLTTGYGYLGCYRFHPDTRVWLANQGSCVRQGIGQIINKGSEVILVPCHQEVI